METSVVIFGLLLRVLNLLAAPFNWFKSRRRRTVPPPRNPLLLCGAVELAEFITTGKHTSEEIVTTFIDRVKEVNPYLNAVVDERYRAAIEDAKEVDRLIQEARTKGTIDQLAKEKPLLGVPFTVKESCSLAGLSNSVGCLDYANSTAKTDGPVVKLVRRAGAIPLLVSNTPELCLGWESTNLIRGATNNPYCLQRTCGGSSGGEAALMGSGASPFSVSSDIAGSIRIPAAFCGVIGHKPTPGIISICAHIPTVSDPQFPKYLTVGPMARRAADLALLLAVMAGDKSTVLRLDEPVDVKRLKVYYMTEACDSIALLPVESAIQDAIKQSVQYLKQQGCIICEDKFKELEDSVELSISVFFSMKGIPNMLQDPANPKRDKSLLLELLKHVVGGARRTLQALLFTALHRNRLAIPDHKVVHYTNRAQQLRDKFTRVLGEDGVFIYPVFNERAILHNQVFTRASGVVYTMIFNVLGLPALSLPVTTKDGLPVAIQVIAGPNQDRLCVEVAKLIEKGFGGWKPPG